MFPDWLNPVLAQTIPLEAQDVPKWSRGQKDFQTGEEKGQTWTTTEIASLLNKKLCHGCNTGWMARLEGRAAPLLTPMILGHPTTLSQPDQITVATWAVKTAMVLETAMDTEEDYFTQEQRDIVMRHDRPPALVRVRAAAIEDLIPPLHYACTRLEIQRDGAYFANMHLYTLQTSVLVLQVLRPHPPPPRNTDFLVPVVSDDFEVPVFPPIAEFFWPPKRSLDNAGMERYRTRNDNPPPLPG